mgnify:CR=1 FL=1|tara:strand:- start:2762 stop:3139 length:378 start_codon:yes stop_codon:yes gene_type:complete
MSTERAIDKLRKAFNTETRSSYTLKKEGVTILKLYWKPLTIADREAINQTLRELNKEGDDGNMEFALQVVIQKAEDVSGTKLFSSGDRVALRRELPMSVLLDVMTKMQGIAEEATPDAVKSPVGE